MKARLDLFDPNVGFNSRKSKILFAFWYIVKCIFFLSPLPWPYSLKIYFLRLFGADIGKGIVIKPRVNIHFPWNLTICDFVWLGENVEIYNFKKVCLGSHVCLSQQCFLCTGNHDFRDPSFSYRNQEIILEDGVWLQARVFVCPGSIIREQTVVTSCSLVKGILDSNRIYAGSPAQSVGTRWLE